MAAKIKIEGRTKTIADLKYLIDSLTIIDGYKIALPKIERKDGFYEFNLIENGFSN